MTRLGRMVFIATAALGLAGCSTYGGYDDYGYGYGYGPRSYGSIGVYSGWYDGYYYPGSGYYVFDRGGRRHRWNDHQRRYWEARRPDRAERRERWRGNRGDTARREWRGNRDDAARREWRRNRQERRPAVRQENRRDVRRDPPAASRVGQPARLRVQPPTQPRVERRATPNPYISRDRRN